jgi:hypothetical protein
MMAAIRLVTALVAVPILTTLGAAAPSARQILDRVTMANASIPNMTADVLFKLWMSPLSGDQPDCEFTGTMVVKDGHAAVQMSNGAAGLICSTLNHYVVGKLFDASEPMASLLDRFDFTVTSEKQVGADSYYLVQGTARDPKANPRAMSAWVDYQSGLISGGTLQYDWGTVNIEQQYTRLSHAWVLALQNVRSSTYPATLQVVYSNFRLSP